MQSDERTYSLTDLARLADVTVRTVRYYITQGLLPSAEAAGPSTRYGEGHLARLRAIRRMQAAHLPLAEIRARLETVSDEEIVRLSEPDGMSALDYVNRVRAESRTPSPAGEALGLWASPSPWESRPRSSPSDPSRPQAVQRSTWERVLLAPDVELHLRRPLDRMTNKRVELLLRAAREIFDAGR